MRKKIVITGAGTIGLHCAYFLTREGHQVEIVEAREEQDENGCSYGNCGFVVPSHFVSLASPAMLHSGLKLLFDAKSPVYLPLKKNIQNIPWFLKFLMAANNKQVQKNAPVLYKLNEASKKLYSEINREHQPSSEFRENGLLMASVTEKGFEEETALTFLAEKLGILTRILAPSDMKMIEPDAEFNIKGAVLYKSDAIIQPEKHMLWLKNWLKGQGVVFHYGEPVEKIKTNSGKIAAFLTKYDSYQADEYVLAAGSMTSGLARLAGLSIPVIAGKGYTIDFPVSIRKLKTPVILTEARVAISPFKDMVRVGSGMEFSGTTGQIRHKRVQTMLDRTLQAIPMLFEQADSRQLPVWEGLRPLSPDGIPYIGRTARYQNLSIAAGHAMMGMSLAPVSGKIISDSISGKHQKYAFSEIHPDRYSG